jgi:hypothetical protein
MKNITVLIFMTFIFFGCKQNSKEEIKNISKIDTTKNEKTIKKATLNYAKESIKIEELSNLIPIDTVDSKSNNVYEKYGLEFSGNCYACDLANFSITEKSIILTNVCDEKQNQNYEVIKIITIDNGIELKTKQHDFIFTKIDNAPIYELKIIGNKIKNEKLRISKYFTLDKILKKFEQQDCGDFQG